MDFKVGQFGKIGENMVAFELSKRGWIVFLPPYDERVDILAMKFICAECGSPWDNTHTIHCININCENYKIIKTTKIEKAKKCRNCGEVFTRNDVSSQSNTCPVCKTNTLEEFPICNLCDNPVAVKENMCKNPQCNSTEYKIIFRSVQVKSTHLVDEGRNLGFNFKYQDLLSDDRHFFVVYLRDQENCVEKHRYWVMNENDFKTIKKIETVSFKIYQNDRGHYDPSSLDKFKYREEETCELKKELEEAQNNKDDKKIEELQGKLKEKDTFLKFDEKCIKD